jgi:endonuclease/exonuclease/phosphatase family metal-dependent hydrolase
MKLSGTLVLLLILTSNLFSQTEKNPESVRVMFYNVENLFDTFDDPLKDDNEFLPGGLRRWNMTKYNEKLNSLYKVIMAAGEWTPPIFVGLCEVENQKVLEDLVYRTYLANYSYGIIHEESQDTRGIDVALLFRKEFVRILDHRSWIPVSTAREDFKTRSVLYVKCEVLSDTIDLIINHWPSRRGGSLAGEKMRVEIAKMVRSAVDSLVLSSAGHVKVIIMGDFNSTPDDQVIGILTRDPAGSNKELQKLVNLSAPDKSAVSGTYRYQGTWELIDQVIVSSWMIECSSGLHTDPKQFRIMKNDFLLKIDGNYPGQTPFSTFRGYRYQGGYSDHLPVLLDLCTR